MVRHTQYDFGGETAVVTGSTKGIGRGIAAGLADANVVVNSRSDSAVESVAAELTERDTGRAVGVAADVESIEGCIGNHTSQAGDRRTGTFGLYGISKTSNNELTWRMAQELAEHGIRMNAVSTDMTETDRTHYEAEQDAENDPARTAEEKLQARGEQRPLGRLGQPEDLADAVLWLASDRVDNVVGDIVRVSGSGNLE